jgi:hypothetical protein
MLKHTLIALGGHTSSAHSTSSLQKWAYDAQHYYCYFTEQDGASTKTYYNGCCGGARASEVGCVCGNQGDTPATLINGDMDCSFPAGTDTIPAWDGLT